MGEHTIREILKRRSPETQRAMERRRKLAGGASAREALVPKLIVALVVLAILGGIGYLGFVAHDASQRFDADKASRGAAALTLASTTEFLPNTLLAAMDPTFYSSSVLSGTGLTHRLLRLWYPGATSLEIRIMSIALEAGHSKTEIMEAFINDAPMGGDSAHPIRGMDAAANDYFGKPFAQLPPQDIALLVAIVTDPVTLDPRRFPSKALEARNAVLQADLQQNVLSQAQVDGLSKLPLDAVLAATKP